MTPRSRRVPAPVLSLGLSLGLALGLALELLTGPAVSVTAAAAGAGSTSTYVVTLRPGATTASLLSSVAGEVTATYFFHALTGFAVRMPAAAATLLRLDPRVASVTPDRRVRATQVQSDPTWGLDRSDQRRLPLNHRFGIRPGRGREAHVYVLDTGLATGTASSPGAWARA